MAENAAVEEIVVPRKNVQVAVTVSAEVYDGLVDNKWRTREEVRDFARRAIFRLIEEEGLVVDGTAPHHDVKKK